MSAYQYIIIGGGISGLYAAYLLEQRGITDYLLLEAKSSLGGRLNSAFATDSSGINAAFDLGATWFWEDQQPELAQLIKDLNLSSFEQYTQGEMLLERSSTQPALHTRDFNGESSKRIDGGMKAFVDQLYARLTADRILLSHQVLQLSHEDHCIKVQVASQAEQVKVFQTSQILMAIPPRLAISSIQFTPALPEHFRAQWQNTATWMAPHAKYIAVYQTAFWRDVHLSGNAHSSVGPLVEIHDASTSQGAAALFGFIGVASAIRKDLSEAELMRHCRHQLIRLFGQQAATPLHEYLKDWAQDPFVATQDDLNATASHGHAPASTADTGLWKNHLVGIASEFSPHYSGFIAGAIEAARLGIDHASQKIQSIQ